MQVLTHLVEAVIKGTLDQSGQSGLTSNARAICTCSAGFDFPASRLRSKVGELLGRIAAQVSGQRAINIRACIIIIITVKVLYSLEQTTVSADIWRLYANYHFASEKAEDHEKVSAFVIF